MAISDQPVSDIQWVPVDHVEPNQYNPNSVATNEMRLLHHSIANDGYCVEESTPVLCADLVWRAAGSLGAGQEIVALDENVMPGSRNHPRSLRTATVTHNRVEESELVVVDTPKGAVTCTPDHPWLARRFSANGKKWRTKAEWIEARALTDKHEVLYLIEPWEQDRSWEAGWLAGFLDGDGTLSPSLTRGDVTAYRLSGYQRPGPTADLMAEEMQKRVECSIFTVGRSSHPKWNDMVMCRVDRLTEIMRLLGIIRPQRLLEVAGRLWENRSLTMNGEWVPVLSVQGSGTGRIASLATSSRTYIAAGFAMHNTQPVVTIWDPERQKYVIVDGFHRWLVMSQFDDIRETTGGYLPVVVIEKDINDRMASTVRHNRARGKHSVDGMANMVFSMLDNGWDDAEICEELGMEPDELVRLKHVTGFSRLFEDVEYQRAWETKRQIRIRQKYQEEHGDG